MADLENVKKKTAPADVPGGDRPLSEAAKRALEEAEARRADREAKIAAMPVEKGGRDGPEPVRYGDWEKKGIASDF